MQQLAAEEEVADDVEVVAEREVLEDRRDAEVLGLGGAATLTGLPSNVIVPSSGRVDPGDGLDEGGLAGAVVADQGDDLAGVHVQSTSLSAWTAPNRLETPCIERTVSVAHRRGGALSWCLALS